MSRLQRTTTELQEQVDEPIRLTKEIEYVDIVLSLKPQAIDSLDKRAKELNMSRSATIEYFISREQTDTKYASSEETLNLLRRFQDSILLSLGKHRHETINLVKDVIARSNEKKQ